MLYHWGLVSAASDSKSKSTEGKPHAILVPTPVPGLQRLKIRKCDLGTHFALALSTDGKVFSWGSGKRGRLGNGSERDESLPKEISALRSINSAIVDVCAGSWHALALTLNGEVYIWGSNSRGECGMSTSQAFLKSPTKLLNLPGPVAHIAAGHQVSACILNDGRVFTWGSGVKGKLGRACAKAFDPSPTEIALHLNEAERPKSIHFGFTYGGIITTLGRLFIFGANSCSQLGRSKTELSETFTPLLVNFAGASEDDRFIDSISCSKGEFHNHTLALTRSGKIWVFGDNYKSKLGTGLAQDCNSPTLLPDLSPGDPVVQVAAGGIHSAALTRSGAVYTWGCGSDGRLGHPECKGHRYLYKEDMPRRVEGIQEVSQLVCCYYSCLAISHANT